MTGRIVPVQPTEVAAVVTHLQLNGPLDWPVPAPPDGIRIERARALSAADYETLFRLVGEAWLWQGRLTMDPTELADYLSHPQTELFIMRDDRGALGFAEINHTAEPTDLAYFGLVERAIGLGLGRVLMGHALTQALKQSNEIHVQTCTLDHPNALAFYEKCGFRAIRRDVEIMRDPRHGGLISRDQAPQIPLLA